MPTVLIVDAEPLTTEPLTYLLEQAGMTVTVVASGPAAIEAVDRRRPDIVLLDLELPGMPGIEVCTELRRSSAVPIIILTATDTEAEKVLALEVGADDYVTKPFSGRELVARIGAVLRRHSEDGPDAAPLIVTAGPVRIDVDRHRVTIFDVETPLRLKEFAVLEFLVRNHGRVMERGQLIERIWGDQFSGDPKRIDAIVKRLRTKIEIDPANPRHLLTVRGLGYRFDA